MTTPRVPMDLNAYERRVREGRCFICELVARSPGSEHEIVYDDGEHLAFLSRYPTSLGSQQGNGHLHWHVAPLPPGTPYREQQYHALMAEHGIIPWDERRAAELGARLRGAIDGQEG